MSTDHSGVHRVLNGAPTITRDRRIPHDRRRTILHALWRGNFYRRRFAPRRESDRHPVATDWFHAKWLAIAVGILLLSSADALLTLSLINHGAHEVNPFMKPLVLGSGRSFALWKLGLTSLGVVVLTLIAEQRVFGRFQVGWLLYLVLGGYAVLVCYEVWLLRLIAWH